MDRRDRKMAPVAPIHVCHAIGRILDPERVDAGAAADREGFSEHHSLIAGIEHEVLPIERTALEIDIDPLYRTLLVALVLVTLLQAYRAFSLRRTDAVALTATY